MPEGATVQTVTCSFPVTSLKLFPCLLLSAQFINMITHQIMIVLIICIICVLYTVYPFYHPHPKGRFL